MKSTISVLDYPEALPLWEEKWNRKTLQDAYNLGPRKFRRGFQLDPYSEEERKLPHFKQAIDAGAGLTVSSLLGQFPNCYRFIGVDPGGDKRPGTAIFVLGAWHEKRFPLSIRFGQWSGEEVAMKVVATYKHWNPEIVYVENNALQSTYMSLIRLLPSAPYVRMLGFHTGKQKSDPDIGVEGLDIEFMQGIWVIPSGEFENHEVGCQCDWCRWKNEMLNYPNWETSDGLMATWFAWNAVRVGAGGNDEAASAGDRESLNEDRPVDEEDYDDEEEPSERESANI